jgi:adenylate cyclase
MTTTLTSTTIHVTPLPNLQEVRLSVGFADMDGFMKAVESGTDADIAALVQSTDDAIGDAITRHGGQIHKYLGDAIFFTNPSPAACASSAHEIAALRFHAPSGAELRFHVSVATGTVVRGTFGHASARGQDIFGHTIHRAAMTGREAKGDPSHVYLDEATRRAIGSA